MPTLAQATSKSIDEIGFEHVSETNGSPDASPVSAPVASYLRSPTPPTGVSADALNLFGQNSAVPQARLFSVPQLSDDTGGGTSVITQTVSVSGGTSTSGGGSSIVVAQAAAVNAAVTTPILNQNDSFQSGVQMAKTFVLIKVAVSSPARVRLYSSLAAQVGDVGRAPATPVPLGTQTGILGDFYLETVADSDWTCSPPVVGFNAEAARSATIFVTVTNIFASTTPVTASFLFVPLES